MSYTLVLAVAGCSDKPAAEPDMSGADVGADLGSPNAVDMVPYACEDPGWSAGACAAGVVTEYPNRGAMHVDLPEPIEYDDSPPASGDHRPEWGKWGEYEFLPPQRWLHNLEHGGVAFLYHPCASEGLITQLREFARSRPDDVTGAFRWVMTPYPGLDTAVAAVAWDWTYEAECVDAANLDEFVANQYRRGPEDIAADGKYEELWLGR